MSGFTSEGVLDRDQSGALAVSPRDAEAVVDMRKQRNVDVLEQSGANEIRLGADQLLCRTRPDPDSAGKLLALHDLLHGKRRRDVQRHAGVVAFAVSWRAF